jgi:hypothetical protein
VPASSHLTRDLAIADLSVLIESYSYFPSFSFQQSSNSIATLTPIHHHQHYTSPNPTQTKPNQPPTTTANMRGNSTQTKCHYKGESEDFIVFVESTKAVEEWKKDKSVPLAQVVDSFKIFVTHK